MPDVDVVVVGSGPGGATAADVLTGAGRSVCVLEKGRNHLLALEPPFASLGHLSSDEVKFDRRHFLGPDPLLEPRTYRRGEVDGDRRFTGDVNNMPSTVGGAGFHADGKLPRYREVDFRLASELGPVDGAAVADWPVGYDEMEPYYAEAEQLIGVAGDHTGNPFAAWRSGPYPMPPGADMYVATLTGPAAERRGYHPYRAPTGANSVPYDGRPACNNCGFCAFYGCPIEAKGDPVGMLRNALRTGRCEIRPESVAVEVLVDGGGRRATGVRYLDAAGDVQAVTADAVVVACGAFETPRLLLRSGIGNSSDLVGRFLMFHLQTIVLGYFPFRLHAYKGRDVTHLMDDPIVGDGDSAAAAAAAGVPYLRGGIVEHGGSGHPITEAVHLPAGRGHSALDGRLAHARPHGGVHHARGGPAPGIEPRRPRPEGARRLGTPERARHVLAAPPRGRVRAPLGAAPRGGDARGGCAGHVVGDVPGHAGHGRARPRAHLEALDGHRPHGRRRAPLGVRPVAAALGRRQRRRHRLLGVPDLDGLRPHAHARRPRDPSVPRLGRSRTDPFRPRRGARQGS